MGGYIGIMGKKMETTRVRAHRSPCCFLEVKVARNLGFSAIPRKKKVVGRLRNYCSLDNISLCLGLAYPEVSRDLAASC